MNIIENIDIKDEMIKHKYATNADASGAPIINIKNYEVIGIHREKREYLAKKCRSLLKESLINFYKIKSENTKGILYYIYNRYEGDAKYGKKECKGIMYMMALDMKEL